MVFGIRHNSGRHVVYDVSVRTGGMGLDEEDLSPAQEAILRMLREGRVTAPFVAEETGYSLQYVREQLTDLVKHSHVEKVHNGLYELVKDPEEGQRTNDR